MEKSERNQQKPSNENMSVIEQTPNTKNIPNAEETLSSKVASNKVFLETKKSKSSAVEVIQESVSSLSKPNEEISPPAETLGDAPESADVLDTKESSTIENVEEYEDIEEEYEEEVEENGELKTVIRKKIFKVKKFFGGEDDGEKKEVDKEENEEDANREVLGKSITEESTMVEEEFEEEEVDEFGVTQMVKKTRKIILPERTMSNVILKRSLLRTHESHESFEEEYETDEEDENGEVVKLIKKRMVRVPVKLMTSFVDDEAELKSDREIEVVVEDVEELEEEEEGEEEEEVEEEEELEVEEKLEEEDEEVIKEDTLEGDEAVKKEAIKYEESLGKKEEVMKEKDEEEESLKFKKKKKKIKRRRKRRAKVIEEEVEEGIVKPEDIPETLVEDKKVSETELTEDLEEEKEVESISSAELRAVAEKEVMAQQFESLCKAKVENATLKKKYLYLTNKLIQYFKKQKMEHVFTEIKEDPDLEQRFLKKLFEFSDKNKEIAEEKQKINTDWESQKTINEDLKVQVKAALDEEIELKKEVAGKLIDSRTGRSILSCKAVDDLIARQESQFKQVSDSRFCQIKLKHRIDGKKLERQMDNMGGDFRLMDFEKLSSLQEYYIDKITERDVEIAGMNQKLRETEEKLNQVKKQFKIKEQEVEEEQLRLQNISSHLVMKRGHLNQIKASRHRTEKRTAKMKQQSGLLAYPILLKDYEQKTEELKKLQSQLSYLQGLYHSNLGRISKLRESIEKRSRAKLSIA